MQESAEVPAEEPMLGEAKQEEADHHHYKELPKGQIRSDPLLKNNAAVEGHPIGPALKIAVLQDPEEGETYDSHADLRKEGSLPQE